MIDLDLYQVRLEKQVNFWLSRNDRRKLVILFSVKTNEWIFEKKLQNLAFRQFWDTNGEIRFFVKVGLSHF